MIDVNDPARNVYAIAAARRLHGDDDCEIDEDTRVIFLDEPNTGVEGHAWVQTWVLIPADEIETEAERQAVAA